MSDNSTPDQALPDLPLPEQTIPEGIALEQAPGQVVAAEPALAVVSEKPVAPVVPKAAPAVPKLVGELQLWKMVLFEGSKGLLYFGAIGLGLYGLTQGSHPAGRLVSGLILLVGALSASFWPAEFKKYVAWFELDGEWFKYRLLRQRKKLKIALPSVRARSRSSRGERYACAINVGDYEEIVVMFRYVSNGRQLWDRLQGKMAERSPEE